jgi:hypothetical protein
MFCKPAGLLHMKEAEVHCRTETNSSAGKVIWVKDLTHLSYIEQFFYQLMMLKFQTKFVIKYAEFTLNFSA